MQWFVTQFYKALSQLFDKSSSRRRRVERWIASQLAVSMATHPHIVVVTPGMLQDGRFDAAFGTTGTADC
jgi:Cft2 family RNA processing exonuclease